MTTDITHMVRTLPLRLDWTLTNFYNHRRDMAEVNLLNYYMEVAEAGLSDPSKLLTAGCFETEQTYQQCLNMFCAITQCASIEDKLFLFEIRRIVERLHTVKELMDAGASYNRVLVEIACIHSIIAEAVSDLRGDNILTRTKERKVR